MALRFTETKKWADDWFLSLSNDNRMVYQWILDNSSIAGILKKEFQMLNYCCRTQFNEKTLKDTFDGKILDCGEFFFIPNFLKYQNPSGLNSHKPAVVSIRKRLLEASEKSPVLKEWIKNHYPMVLEPFPNGFKTIKGKGKGKGSSYEEGNGEKQKSKVFKKPTPEEAEAYALTLGFNLDGQAFYNHYEASGWMRGKTKITNWKACVATWKKNGGGNSHSKKEIVL